MLKLVPAIFLETDPSFDCSMLSLALNPFRLCGPLVDLPKKNFAKNRNYLELSRNQYRAYFKHADYEYEHDFLKFCLHIGPNGTKNGTNDKKFMLHRIVSKLVQSLFQTC